MPQWAQVTMSCGGASDRLSAPRRRRWLRSSHIPSATTIATSRNLTIDFNLHAERSAARHPEPCTVDGFTGAHQLRIQGQHLRKTRHPIVAPDGRREFGDFTPGDIRSQHIEHHFGNEAVLLHRISARRRKNDVCSERFLHCRTATPTAMRTRLMKIPEPGNPGRIF